MATRAFFGPPRNGPVEGGLQVSVHLVPVWDGRLLIFDVDAAPVRGRWLPWAVIDYGQNPYEAASILADDWLGVALSDLSLADVLSIEGVAGGWELAIVFRAELAAPATGDAQRHPVLCERGAYDAIGSFDPIDLQRWVERGPADSVAAGGTALAEETAPVPGSPGLLF